MSDNSPWSRTQALLGTLTASFEEGDATKYSRTDILRALSAPMAGTGVAFPLLALSKSPGWALVGDAVLFALSVLLYLGYYAYCFAKRPDDLRSEKFQLTKYAIQQQVYGDNITGLIEIDPQSTSDSLLTAQKASPGDRS